MDIQVATLCDHAADYNGKLCVTGSFDTIAGRQLPIVHSQCAIALRLCFRLGDEGQHKLGIRFIDADGGNILNPPFEAKMNIAFPNDSFFMTRNIVISMQRVEFKQTGHYSIDVSIDDDILSRIPVRVMLANAQPQQQQPPS